MVSKSTLLTFGLLGLLFLSSVLAQYSTHNNNDCWCGNGRVDQADEECDEGSANGRWGCGCDANCKRVRCGNGRLEPWNGEECDLGAENGRYGCNCTASCQFVRPSVCFNGTACDGQTFSFCVPYGTFCAQQRTCARNPATGKEYQFPSSCVPYGWVHCGAECYCPVQPVCDQLAINFASDNLNLPAAGNFRVRVYVKNTAATGSDDAFVKFTIAGAGAGFVPLISDSNCAYYDNVFRCAVPALAANQQTDFIIGAVARNSDVRISAVAQADDSRCVSSNTAQVYVDLAGCNFTQ